MAIHRDGEVDEVLLLRVRQVHVADGAEGNLG
jgi:hypothetical protein